MWYSFRGGDISVSSSIVYKRKRQGILVATFIFNLIILGYFKYTNFFLGSIYDIIGKDYTPLKILLPVGISFYTFSSISYIVDVYQRKLEPTKDVIAFLSYVSFFPSILSGPIHKATEQLPQFLNERSLNYNQIARGFKNFVWGAFMKACVADALGLYVDTVYSNITHHNGTTLLLTSILYTIQIYADFAGYSLMAIGCGKMLGVELQTNFNKPYFSRTITEFWAKWHMSLTGWFRNYVYFPLGGNRVSKPRWIFNIIAVFLLSGLWHGAAYTFIIWGAIHGVVQVIEKLIYGDKLKKISNDPWYINGARIILTFSIVSFAWIFFRLPSLNDALCVIYSIFTDKGAPFIDAVLYPGILSLGILFIKEVIELKIPNFKLFNSNNSFVSYATIIVLIVYIMLVGDFENSSFIYFQF